MDGRRVGGGWEVDGRRVGGGRDEMYLKYFVKICLDISKCRNLCLFL